MSEPETESPSPMPTLEEMGIDPILLDQDTPPEQVVYAAWIDGELGDIEAVRSLAPLLRQAEDVLRVAENRLGVIKDMIRQMYNASGMKALTVPEWELEITNRAGYTKYTPDVKVVKQVIADLYATGDAYMIEFATTLAAGIKESQVAGGATVGRPKR